jgi:hypothetical protein
MRIYSRSIKQLICVIAIFSFTSVPVAAQKAVRKKATPAIAPDVQTAMDKISANSLRGHLSFIASDLLEGRGTPSRGLDLAAEYIAAQFRRAGLEPVGDDGYFQTADWAPMRRNNSETPQPTNAPPAKVRNVIGLLRGSDPVLKDTYILVTAHYDHLGIRENLEGDKIFNGANDDGSGTVSVIELASVLAAMKTRPKRSLVFMTFYGEERGLVGSRYYGDHPIFPVEKTVADINLEHMGRTDDAEGEQKNSASVTGMDYSDVGTILQKAGELTGIKVYKHPRNSDQFFGASDNQALADRGVPAHTICTAFIFPDYHKVGDHWDKVDFDNLAKVNRMVALALVTIANNLKAPMWNAANPKAAKYLKAWQERHGK